MKVYALRTEKPQTVLGKLAEGVTPSQIAEAYAHYIETLCKILKTHAAEEVRVELHDFKKLEQQKQAWLEPGQTYVSFDSQSALGIDLGVSRHFDFLTQKQQGVTSRPGYDELTDQIKVVATQSKAVTIIDDDVFTGGTLGVVIKALQDVGATVKGVIVGISTANVAGDSGVPIRSVVHYNRDELFELTDPRDYIFGANQGGLVVSYRGQKFRVPYCAPFTNVAERSSIHPDKVAQFSKAIIAANLKLHGAIGSLGHKAVLFYPRALLRRFGFPIDMTLGEMLEHTQKIVQTNKP